ncbi:DUF4258 domain-containing protein [Methylobacterium sp. EM32]|uniref:DUF4258 domain-containing protein n=1 Tax=Methylobacterium sp. EM32 TaxID=3163481 RepID=UPI0033A1F7D9
MRVTYTHHAQTVMAERDLDPEWIERTVRRPDQVEPDVRDPALLRAFAAVPGCGGRVLCVVYKPAPEGCIIVTTFLDRRRRVT